MTLDEAIKRVSGWPDVSIICAPVVANERWEVIARCVLADEGYTTIGEFSDRPRAEEIAKGLREHRAVLRKLRGD